MRRYFRDLLMFSEGMFIYFCGFCDVGCCFRGLGKLNFVSVSIEFEFVRLILGIKSYFTGEIFKYKIPSAQKFAYTRNLIHVGCKSRNSYSLNKKKKTKNFYKK